MIQVHDVYTQDMLAANHSDWLALLRDAVAKDPRGITGVSEKLQYEERGGRGKSAYRKTYSRGYVSQFLNGINKVQPSQGFLISLNRQFGGGRLACPAQCKNITQDECKEYQQIPFSRVVGLGYDRTTAWHVCRKCELRSEK